MSSYFIKLTNALPRFLEKSSLNIHLEGWPACISVCGLGFSVVAIAHMVLEDRRINHDDTGVEVQPSEREVIQFDGNDSYET